MNLNSGDQYPFFFQLICEAYHIMKDVLGMSHDEMAATFEEWNKGELDSFLIEISANILKYKDSNGEPLVKIPWIFFCIE